MYNTDYKSPVDVGRRVKKLVDRLEELEGITYEYTRMGKSKVRTHVFKRDIV